jgi:hypothetical protein
VNIEGPYDVAAEKVRVDECAVDCLVSNRETLTHMSDFYVKVLYEYMGKKFLAKE